MRRSTRFRHILLAVTLATGSASAPALAAKPNATAAKGLFASKFPNTTRALSKRSVAGKANRAGLAEFARRSAVTIGVGADQIAALEKVAADPGLRALLPPVKAELAAIKDVLRTAGNELGFKPALAAGMEAAQGLAGDPLALAGLKKINAHVTAISSDGRDINAYAKGLGAKLFSQHPMAVMGIVNKFHRGRLSSADAMALMSDPATQALAQSAAQLVGDEAGLSPTEQQALASRLKAISIPMIEIGGRIVLNEALLSATIAKMGPNIAALRSHADKVQAYVLSQHPELISVLREVLAQVKAVSADKQNPQIVQLAAEINANPSTLAVLAALDKDLKQISMK